MTDLECLLKELDELERGAIEFPEFDRHDYFRVVGCPTRGFECSTDAIKTTELLKINKIRNSLRTLLNLIERQRRALELYADPRGWSKMGEGTYQDVGLKARQTLSLTIEELKAVEGNEE